MLISVNIFNSIGVELLVKMSKHIIHGNFSFFKNFKPCELQIVESLDKKELKFLRVY